MPPTSNGWYIAVVDSTTVTGVYSRNSLKSAFASILTPKHTRLRNGFLFNYIISQKGGVRCGQKPLLRRRCFLLPDKQGRFPHRRIYEKVF